MSEDAVATREIDGRARTVRELLHGRKYAIDYYQREYKWEKKQVAELIEDLVGKFREDHQEGRPREAVRDYGHYFLGSIIVSQKDGRRYIIDGQQRLTTLTLLLIALYLRLDDPNHKGQVSGLIFSQQFGVLSFNLDVPERKACMEAIFRGEEPPDAELDESSANLLQRFADVGDLLPDDVTGEALPYFTDWVMENVHLVEITAHSDNDAYTIFETMNDRGLSLTPADMLKGYLLANIEFAQQRTAAAGVWKERMQALAEVGKDDGADAVKAWLRSQWADTIRERKKDAQPLDFDRIGTEFHRWVRDSEERLGLAGSADYVRFVERDFRYYSRWYARLRRASESLTDGLERVLYNAQHNFTLQYPLMLAPLTPEDDDMTARRKVRVVAAYVDILINRRLWNWKAIDYSTMQYAMFSVMRDIRGKDPESLIDLLHKRLRDDTAPDFGVEYPFVLNGTNGPYVHRMLARMTQYIEMGSGKPPRYIEYAQRGRGGYEIEHIWANHPERHTDEFSHPSDFLDYRRRIGCLVLLPKSFNASYSDMPYVQKRPHYLSQNLLAASLHEQTYDHNPGFRAFLEQSGLPFQPHGEFGRADLERRQELYRLIARQVWDPGLLETEAQT
jgi:hypothetical protein